MKYPGIPLFVSFELIHRVFGRRRYTVTTNGKYRHPPPGFAVPPTAGFHSMHHILAENPPVYICLAVLNQDEFGLLPIDTLPGNKPREDKKKEKSSTGGARPTDLGKYTYSRSLLCVLVCKHLVWVLV